jgi:hypothetical protein
MVPGKTRNSTDHWLHALIIQVVEYRFIANSILTANAATSHESNKTTNFLQKFYHRTTSGGTISHLIIKTTPSSVYPVKVTGKCTGCAALTYVFFTSGIKLSDNTK